MAFNPRGGHTKVVVSKNLMMKPNASAAATLIEKGGGEIVQEYETQTLAYFLTESLKSLTERAAELGVEIRVRDDFDQIYLPEGIVDARKGVAGSLPGLPMSAPYKKGESGVYLLQFAGPILPEWEKQVESFGVKPVQYIPYNAYLVAATPEAISSAEKLSFVQLIDMLHVALKVHPKKGKDSETQQYIVQLIDAPGVDALIGTLGARAIGNATTRRFSRGELDLQATFDARDLPDILSSPLVLGVVEAPVVQMSDERVALSLTRNVTGPPTARVPTPVASPGTYKSWLEAICPFCTNLQADHFWFGEADPSGLDQGTHSGSHNPALPDSKIRFGSNFETPGAPLTSASSHGTMIAGIVAGDTTNATGTDPDNFYYASGIAPSAGVYVTKILFSSTPGLTTRTVDAVNDAAHPPDSSDTIRVQNHSYNTSFNSCFGGVYSSLSRDFDASVLDADNGLTTTLEPMVLTVSAGNILGHGVYCPETNSLTSPPATAKNVISVGSAEVPRSTAEQWECHYCGQDSLENIAADSMRATGIAGWYKPDLFAPAENIVSTRSTGADSVADANQCDQKHLPLVDSPGSPYLKGGGTSFAAPVAAGAALLARRFYEEVIHPGCHGSSSSTCDPTSSSPALTKAMLIAGARSMAGGTETTLQYDGAVWSRVNGPAIGPFPNNQQGFGRISLEDVLAPYPLRYFLNGTTAIHTGGGEWGTTLTVHDPALPVKIALVWTDQPSPAATQPPTGSLLVNDLDLRVELPTTPCTRYVGNQLTIPGTRGEESQVFGCTGGTFDRMNNVEVIRFFAPAGVTTFNVAVTNVTGNGGGWGSFQDFALVAYNAYDASSSSHPIDTPVITGDTTSSTRITISWSPVSGATGYDIRWKSGLSGGSQYSTPVHVTSNTYDSGSSLTPNTAYVWQVRATRPPFASGWSVPDLATTSQYTHPAAGNHVAAADTVFAADFTELRTVVNSVRMAAGLPPFSFTDPSLSSGYLIRLAHLSELRAALDAARTSLGLPAATYTDPQLIPGTTRIKAAHINDIRDGVQ
jgi:hypothetical protein